MRRVIRVVVAGAAVVAGGWWLASLPGRISIELGTVTVETSTALAIAVGLLVLVVILALFRLLLAVVAAGAALRSWGAGRRRAAGHAALTQALVAIAAGQPESARRAAARARRTLGDGAQPLLLAAEAERLAGDQDAAAALYARLAQRPDAALLGLRGLFRQALAREDWTEAAAVARRAEAAYPGGGWLREERERLAARIGDWRQAGSLAPPGAPERADFAAAAAEAASDPAEGERLARKAFADFPGFAPAALAYAARLRARGREDRARDVLTRAWAAAPMPDIAAFALAPQADPMGRLKAAGRLVAGQADHPESHLLLARLNLQAGLTGEARRHLNAARLPLAADRRFWLLLADLEGVERGDTETGRLAQRDALRRAAEATLDPVWRCVACGTTLPHWQPACAVCHAPGQVRWAAAAQMAVPRPDGARGG